MTIKRNIELKGNNSEQQNNTAWSGAVDITAVNKNLWWMFWKDKSHTDNFVKLINFKLF